MRLSDVKGERTLDVIAELVEPVANIASDKKVVEALKSGNGEVAATMRSFVPALLKTHRKEVLLILATIKGVTVKEYTADMTMASVLADCYELLTDSEFLGFLSSPEQTAE